MLIRIIAPDFVAGIDYPTRFAPKVRWMQKRHFLVSDILHYCWMQGWEVKILDMSEPHVVSKPSGWWCKKCNRVWAKEQLNCCVCGRTREPDL